MESRLNDGLRLDLETMNLKIATIAELRQRIRREKMLIAKARKKCVPTGEVQAWNGEYSGTISEQRRIEQWPVNFAAGRYLQERNRVEDFLLNTSNGNGFKKRKRKKETHEVENP